MMTKDRNIKPAYYATIYSLAKIAAREVGWCLTVHGSMARDLDLLAVPWTEDAISRDEFVGHLVHELRHFMARQHSTTEKPFGRVAHTILVDCGCIDLSVVTPDTEQLAAEQEKVKALQPYKDTYEAGQDIVLERKENTGAFFTITHPETVRVCKLVEGDG